MKIKKIFFLKKQNQNQSDELNIKKQKPKNLAKPGEKETNKIRKKK